MVLPCRPPPPPTISENPETRSQCKNISEQQQQQKTCSHLGKWELKTKIQLLLEKNKCYLYCTQVGTQRCQRFRQPLPSLNSILVIFNIQSSVTSSGLAGSIHCLPPGTPVRIRVSCKMFVFNLLVGLVGKLRHRFKEGEIFTNS